MMHDHHEHQHMDDNHHNHDHHDHSHMVNDFKKRLLISAIITIPILILSHTLQDLFGLSWDVPYNSYILLALATAVFFYRGWPFITGGVSELKDKNPCMMTLIALAIFVSYVYSSLTVFGLEGSDFFRELATLIDIMLLGHWIEMRSVMV